MSIKFAKGVLFSLLLSCHVIGANDLSICWIARLPRINYVWGSSNPKVEGWPGNGQKITWHGVIKYWGNTNPIPFNYKWFLDGVEIDRGAASIAPDDTAGINLEWNWTFERHILRLVIDPENIIEESEENNNELSVYTDAISVGFHIEQSLYTYFYENQPKLNVHSTCFENWAQRQIQWWNKLFSNAIYPETPEGVYDRVRLDWIRIVPDGSYPIVYGSPEFIFDRADRSVDLQWGFPAINTYFSLFRNHTDSFSVSNIYNPFYLSTLILHEVMHARYLIDVGGFNVNDFGDGATVGIKLNNKLIVGTYLMPYINERKVFVTMPGIMGSQGNFIDRYSAAALNLIAGHRAILNNYNPPNNLGVFLNDLPSQNRILFKDQQGKILANAQVYLYRSSGNSKEWYGKYYSDPPSLSFTSDADGFIDAGRCPFDADGVVDHDFGLSNAVLLFRVETNGSIGFAFLDITGFNLAYWRGEKEYASHELCVNMQQFPAAVKGDIRAERSDLSALGNYPNPFNQSTTFEWNTPTRDVVHLRIYDLCGKRIREFVLRNPAGGTHRLAWNGCDDLGRALPSGLYRVQLTSADRQVWHKVMLIK